jgi:oligopeptide transport system ATP-binding protein
MNGTLLEVERLTTQFRTRAGIVTAVNDVSFSIASGETVGIVGESGSGKSVTSLSIMRLVPPPGRITNGKVIFEGRDTLTLSREQMRKLRGGEMAMIFQDPMSSLNPLLTIGRQIAESVMEHQGLGRKAAYERAVEMLSTVGVPGADRRVRSYPHEFSGGMRQRVMIAMALANNPKLLIADEPTTALDVTIQAQVLDLIRELSREFNSSVIFITHNLGVIASIATRVVVMYAGRVVETGSTAQIFYRPQHPYTHALLTSIPRLDQPRGHPFTPIPGQPPDLVNQPLGCPFVPRCPRALTTCRERMPPLDAAIDAPDHRVACWNPVKEEAA